jgi:hypothetical protein
MASNWLPSRKNSAPSTSQKPRLSKRQGSPAGRTRPRPGWCWSVSGADTPLDTPAPLLAVTSGRRRSRDLLYAILRLAAAKLNGFDFWPWKSLLSWLLLL